MSEASISQPTLHIPILYGSQTGNSESCAKSLAASLPSKLYNSGDITPSQIKITSTAEQLDDFLELDKAPWTRFVIIICSSYGVGQAPLGCWKFRDLCDAILDSGNEGKEDPKMKELDGIQYAMLGLGDSKYSTFFKNPTTLDKALQKKGALRVGTLGKADASGEGSQAQSNVMKEWCNDIIKVVKDQVVDVVLHESLQEKKDIEEKLCHAKSFTCMLCKELFDDWEDEDEELKKTSAGGMNNFVIALIAVLAILIAMYMKKF